MAWSFAMTHPEMLDRLVILNLPHFNGLWRELANNPDQQKASAYARHFQTQEAAKNLNPKALTFWIKEAAARERGEPRRLGRLYARVAVGSKMNCHRRPSDRHRAPRW